MRVREAGLQGVGDASQRHAGVGARADAAGAAAVCRPCQGRPWLRLSLTRSLLILAGRWAGQSGQGGGGP